jgi:hypothetical protein
MTGRISHHIRSLRSALYPVLNPNGGIYIVEDLHVNYFPAHGGSRYSKDSFLAFAKSVSDCLHDHVYSDKYYFPRLRPNLPFFLKSIAGFLSTKQLIMLTRFPQRRAQEAYIVKTLKSLHFYTYIVVFEKSSLCTYREVDSGSALIDGASLGVEH